MRANLEITNIINVFISANSGYSNKILDYSTEKLILFLSKSEKVFLR